MLISWGTRAFYLFYYQNRIVYALHVRNRLVIGIVRFTEVWHCFILILIVETRGSMPGRPQIVQLEV